MEEFLNRSHSKQSSSISFEKEQKIVNPNGNGEKIIENKPIVFIEANQVVDINEKVEKQIVEEKDEKQIVEANVVEIQNVEIVKKPKDVREKTNVKPENDIIPDEYQIEDDEWEDVEPINFLKKDELKTSNRDVLFKPPSSKPKEESSKSKCVQEDTSVSGYVQPILSKY